MLQFNTKIEILETLKLSGIVCIADSEDVENEIDLMCLGKFAYRNNVNFMITFGRRLVCVPMSFEFAENHGFNQIQFEGFSPDVRQTPFAQPVDLKTCHTGISAVERSHTIRHLADPAMKKSDFISFGHVFTLIARKGLLQERHGHTEASVKLAKICDKSSPVACICEIVKRDGTMLRVKDFLDWNKNFGLKICHVDDIKKW